MTTHHMGLLLVSSKYFFGYHLEYILKRIHSNDGFPDIECIKGSVYLTVPIFSFFNAYAIKDLPVIKIPDIFFSPFFFLKKIVTGIFVKPCTGVYLLVVLPSPNLP